MYFTPVGVRIRQTQNRRRLDNAAELVCPIHGPRSSNDLVRLTSGELLCPDCYKETHSMGSSIGDRLSSVGLRRHDTGGSGIGRKIRRVLVLIVGLVVALVLLPTTVTYVNPGYVGIVIHRAGGGVDKVPLGPGLHLRNPLTTGIEEYPVFMQTLVLTKSATEGSFTNDEINVNSKEGQPLSLDVSMSFELDQDKAPQLYTTFRRDIADDSARLREAVDPPGAAGGDRQRGDRGGDRPEEGRGGESDAARCCRSGWRSTASS